MQIPPLNLFVVQHCQILEVDSQWKYIMFKVQRIAHGTVFTQGLYLVKTEKKTPKTNQKKKLKKKAKPNQTNQHHLRQWISFNLPNRINKNYKPHPIKMALKTL